MSKSQALAHAPKHDIAEMPDFGEDAGLGAQNTRADELQTPFLAIAQSNSKILKRGDAKFVAEARPGDLYNTVTQEVYNGEEGVEIMPCFRQSLYTLWTPIEEGGGFHGTRDIDDQEIAALIREQGKFPAERIRRGFDKALINSDGHQVVEQVNLYVIYGGPAITEENFSHAVLAFKSTSIGVHRTFYTAAKAIGNAAHSMMMGRGKEIAEGRFNNWMTKEAKAFRSEHEAAGKTVILSKHMAHATDMVKAARAQLDAIGWHEAFREGHGEVVIAWREGDTWFRSMLDWVASPTHLYDFKTGAVSFAPHAIPLKMEGDGWHIQAAMHERGLDVLDPTRAGRRKFRFAAQENYPPYALVGVELDEHWMTMGRKKLAYAVELWRRCIAANGWPSYPPEVLRPVYPGFKETQWLDREIAADHLMAG